MDIASALNETMARYDLTAVDISKKAGISESELSRFRTGERKNLRGDRLMAVVKAMPPYARAYFHYLCFDADTQKTELSQV